VSKRLIFSSFLPEWIWIPLSFSATGKQGLFPRG